MHVNTFFDIRRSSLRKSCCILIATVFTVLFFCIDVERMEEERIRKQRAAVERAFHEGLTKAKLVMRRVPLGTDRNHNRYTHTPYLKTNHQSIVSLFLKHGGQGLKLHTKE